jgi:hypothetical protein
MLASLDAGINKRTSPAPIRGWPECHALAKRPHVQPGDEDAISAIGETPQPERTLGCCVNGGFGFAEDSFSDDGGNRRRLRPPTRCFIRIIDPHWRNQMDVRLRPCYWLTVAQPWLDSGADYVDRRNDLRRSGRKKVPITVFRSPLW